MRFSISRMGRAIALPGSGDFSARSDVTGGTCQLSQPDSGEKLLRATFGHDGSEKTANEWTLSRGGGLALVRVLAAVQWKPGLEAAAAKLTTGLGSPPDARVCTGATFATIPDQIRRRDFNEAVVRTGPLEEAQSAFTSGTACELTFWIKR